MKTLRLEFEDGDSVTVRVSPVPVEDLFDVLELLEKAASRAAYQRLADRFAPYVESWTFPEDPDPAGLMRRDVNFLVGLVAKWRDGVRDVPLPLLVTSSDGDPSETPAA